MFREALGGAELTEEWKEMLPWGMWLVNLGIILFFVQDESEGQTKSHKLADRFVEIVAAFVEWTSSTVARPFARPLQGKMLQMLREVWRSLRVFRNTVVGRGLRIEAMGNDDGHA